MDWAWVTMSRNWWSHMRHWASALGGLILAWCFPQRWRMLQIQLDVQSQRQFFEAHQVVESRWAWDWAWLFCVQSFKSYNSSWNVEMTGTLEPLCHEPQHSRKWMRWATVGLERWSFGRRPSKFKTKTRSWQFSAQYWDGRSWWNMWLKAVWPHSHTLLQQFTVCDVKQNCAMSAFLQEGG